MGVKEEEVVEQIIETILRIQLQNRTPTIPCLSAMQLKLESWLKFHGIKYENVQEKTEKTEEKAEEEKEEKEEKEKVQQRFKKLFSMKKTKKEEKEEDKVEEVEEKKDEEKK